MGFVVLPVILIAAMAGAASAQPAKPLRLPLEELLETYRSDAPGQPEAEVRLDGWIEEGVGGGRELVIVLEPEGETKLNADPGIMVTPEVQDEIRWGVVTPFRHADPSILYFEPSATVRMPFHGEAEQPIVVLVEFAYCVVDFQCFFGEEELTVAALD